MNILITGCNGQLGNEMQLLEKNYPQHRFFNTDVKELDITNQLAINDFVNRNQIDGIVNCAAYTAVDEAETDSVVQQSLRLIRVGNIRYDEHQQLLQQGKRKDYLHHRRLYAFALQRQTSIVGQQIDPVEKRCR